MGHDDASTLDDDVVERHNALAARLRQMEQQHSNDKLLWKLKLETALANERQASTEKEEYRAQFENLNNLHKQVVESRNEVVDLHNESVKTHEKEQKKLQERIQSTEEERKTSMLRQRELQLEVSELTAQRKLLEVSVKEESLKFKQEKDEMSKKLSSQRAQIEKLKESNTKNTEMCDQLKKTQQKHVKEQQDAKSRLQSNAKELAQLKEQLQKLKQKEAEMVEAKKNVADLNKKLETANKKERTLLTSIKDLQAQKKEHTTTIQLMDEELAGWKATARKLEICVDNLVEMESKTNSSYHDQIDSIVTSLKQQLEEASQQQDELALTCAHLEDEAAAWRCQCSELEKSLVNAKKESEKDRKKFEELHAQRLEQEELLKKQQAELADCQEAYTRVEQCVEDLMRLENETSSQYQEQIVTLTRQVEELELRNHVLDGLRVDDELGLETVYMPLVKKHQQKRETGQENDSILDLATLSTVDEDEDDAEELARASIPPQHVTASEEEIEIEIS